MGKLPCSENSHKLTRFYIVTSSISVIIYLEISENLCELLKIPLFATILYTYTAMLSLIDLRLVGILLLLCFGFLRQDLTT